ncbi:MAG: hypothetical protein ACLVDB_03430 [Anaeromassilibacillus sp.]|jgi:hypothetical protein
MERLTFLNGDEIPCVRNDQCFEEQSEHYCGPAIDRLAAYEDTGLTPEEVRSMCGEWCAMMSVWNSIGNYDRLHELAEADRDGRVVVLPCKVGDTVYFALLGRIIEKQVFSIVSFSNSTRIYCGGTSEYFRPEDIGKTFFLTHEEAEKALEGIK